MASRKKVPLTKPHFFKPFLPGSELQMSIPVAFFRHLEGQYCDNVLLRDAKGKRWPVKIKEKKLQDGWEEFVREHGLKVGNFLVFGHEGDMLFDVKIFDNSYCEREFTWTASTRVDVNSKNDALNKEDTELQKNKEPKSQRESEKKTKVNSTVQEKAKPSLLKNPCFGVTLTSTTITRCALRIPTKFARRNFPQNAYCEILLENQEGKSWTAKLKSESGYRHTFFRDGWMKFRSENNLQCGDSLIFELVKKGKRPEFKMHGLRKAKKAPNPARKKLPICDKITASSFTNPYFTASMNTSNGKKYQLFVPARFARSNGLFNRSCSVIVEDERGKRWPMSLSNSDNRVFMGNGWWNFVLAKGLETGDRIILELVQNREKLLMKFHGIVEEKSAADAQQ